MVAVNGEEAVRIFDEHQGSIDLVFLDIIMPGLMGTEAYEPMKAVRPDVRAIFATGYVSETPLMDLTSHEGLTVLQKPKDPKLLGAQGARCFGPSG